MKRVKTDDIYRFWLSGVKEEAKLTAEAFLDEDVYQFEELIEDEKHLTDLLSDNILNALERDLYEFLPDVVLEQFGESFIVEKEGKEIEVNRNNVDEVVPKIIKEHLLKEGVLLEDLAYNLAKEIVSYLDINYVIEDINNVISSRKVKGPRF